MHSLGMSIRRTQQVLHPQEKTPNPVQTAAQAEATWEDYVFNEEDLVYHWYEFAARLPKEEAANAGRMMNMKPVLQGDKSTFEVVVDNEIVQKYMQQLAPQIEDHLRTQLQKPRIFLTHHLKAFYMAVSSYIFIGSTNPYSHGYFMVMKLRTQVVFNLRS